MFLYSVAFSLTLKDLLPCHSLLLAAAAELLWWEGEGKHAETAIIGVSVSISELPSSKEFVFRLVISLLLTFVSEIKNKTNNTLVSQHVHVLYGSDGSSLEVWFENIA